jgi:hypothetical protein
MITVEFKFSPVDLVVIKTGSMIVSHEGSRGYIDTCAVKDGTNWYLVMIDASPGNSKTVWVREEHLTAVKDLTRG